ncbi:MAG: hypothetical protein E7476_07720 [Ruminococcaceae bacterium]|nr:hypothetical protein [Oscillospiraceae bacterium]
MFKKREFTAEQLIGFLMTLLMFFFLVAIPLSINNSMMSWTIPTADNLDNSDWLGFWGGYIGSAFTIIITFIVFLATYIQNGKQHRATREEMREQARLQIMPFLNVEQVYDYKFQDEDYIHGFSFVGEGFSQFHGLFSQMVKAMDTDDYLSGPIRFYLFTFNNIGASTLVDLKIEYNGSDQDVGNLRVNQQVSYFFAFPFEQAGFEHEFMINFRDLHNNLYQQSFNFKFDLLPAESFSLGATEYPELINTVTNS